MSRVSWVEIAVKLPWPVLVATGEVFDISGMADIGLLGAAFVLTLQLMLNVNLNGSEMQSFVVLNGLGAPVAAAILVISNWSVWAIAIVLAWAVFMFAIFPRHRYESSAGNDISNNRLKVFNEGSDGDEQD